MSDKIELITIGIVVGSIRKESLNKKLASAVIKLAPPGIIFKNIKIDDLPLYNQDDEQNQAGPVTRLKEEIKTSSGILFVTPEYNRSIPGVLKNAIDLGSRPYKANVWSKKPAGIIGISSGAIGTALAQQHLRNILVFLNMPVLAQPEVFIQAREGLFDDQGGIGPGSRAFLQSWMDQYIDWIKKHIQE